MFKRSKLSQAVTLAIAAGAVGVSGSALAQEDGALVIEEIMVTATKRSESMQDIPLAVQAMGAEMLDDREINSFSDYLKELPNVTFAGRGPGQNDVYIRGISTSKGSLWQAGGIGAGPTVAMYIDEAPITAAGRNLDVYVSDINRIEVLPGPQGTLYGASSQAGTLRLITNKPEFNEFSSGIDLTYSTTSKGSPSDGIEGYINIPVIEDRLAVRIAAYDVNYGGYIDNVPGTISFADSKWLTGSEAGNLYAVDANTVYNTADNAAYVKNDFNDSYYTGARISARLAINDDWDLSIGFMTQELGADGVFDYSADVGDLKVQRFNPDRLRDEFDQINWTLEGRLGALDVIYTGSYLERDVEQQSDYVGYTNVGKWQPYYNCLFGSTDTPATYYDHPYYSAPAAICDAPDQNYYTFSHSENTQHELRFSTDPGKPLSFVGGIYFDESDAGVSQNWFYQSALLGMGQNGPHPLATHYDPNPRPQGVTFFNDLISTTEQIAYFGELTYRFNDAWSATLGLRNYDIDMTVVGSANFGWCNFGGIDRNEMWGYWCAGPLLDYKEVDGAQQGLAPANESDTIGKLTVSYGLNADTLLYATYSEGFRRGGFNRSGDISATVDGVDLFFPGYYNSDTIENIEFGWKTTLMDGRLRFNGSVYRIDWDNIQIDIFDQAINVLLFTANSGVAEVTGLEGDIILLATDNLTLNAAFSFNDTELVDRPDGASNLSPDGSDLALTPSFQGNFGIRYDFEVKGLDAYSILAVQHRGNTHTSVVVAEDFDLSSYTMADASFGFGRDNWKAGVFISNLTDKRSELFIGDQDDIVRTVTSRPRTIGVKLSYDF